MPTTLNRSTRRWIEFKNPRRVPGVEGTATTLKKTRVVIEPGFGVSSDDELLILAGMALIKEKHPQIEFSYLTPTEEIVPLLSTAWFLKNVALATDEAREKATQNGAFLVTLDQPDPQEAYAAEEEDYKRWFAAEKAEKEEQQRAYDILGVKDIKIQMPNYAYEPQWHKSNAFTWKIADTLGLPFKVPTKAVRPYGTVPSSILKPLHRKLENIRLADGSRLGSISFVVYDFRTEQAAMALLGSVMKVFPEFQIVSIEQVEKELGDSLTTLLALCNHPRCAYVICPVGPLSIASWGAEVPNMFQLYQGANSLWDGSHAKNEYVLDRDRFSDMELPRALEYALNILRDRLDLL